MCKCCDKCNCNCEETKNGIKIEITTDDKDCAEKMKKIINACKDICSCC